MLSADLIRAMNSFLLPLWRNFASPSLLILIGIRLKLFSRAGGVKVPDRLRNPLIPNQSETML